MWFNPMPVTLYEMIRLAAEPFLPVLYARSRSDLKRLVASRPQPVTLLDVGGRKSPYTIGLPAQVTITELPRESALQERLNLVLLSESAATLLTVPWHNLCSRFESRGLKEQPQRTAHLFAVAVKGK